MCLRPRAMLCAGQKNPSSSWAEERVGVVESSKGKEEKGLARDTVGPRPSKGHFPVLTTLGTSSPRGQLLLPVWQMRALRPGKRVCFAALLEIT